MNVNQTPSKIHIFPTKKKLKSMLLCKISASSFVFNYMARTQYASDTT